jgi:reactive chlorine resistance protein C
MHNEIRNALSLLARSDRFGAHLMRIAIAIVFFWIGALKFVPYEADSITPFVARSPLMSFFYEKPDEYKAHLTREGELKPAERTWQTANNTYGFSRGLGTSSSALAWSPWPAWSRHALASQARCSLSLRRL